MKAHIRSLKAHIDELAAKDYASHSELRSPDFVMMFVPIEASLSLALQSENDLFVYGWDKRIILVTPTTLLMSLRTVANLWRHEKQSQMSSKSPVSEASSMINSSDSSKIWKMWKIYGTRSNTMQALWTSSQLVEEIS